MDKLKQEEKTQDSFEGIINKLPIENTYTGLTSEKLDKVFLDVMYGKRRKRI